MNVLKNEKGFTLIELVLIIVILGILAAVAIVQFGTLSTDARDAAVNGGYGSYQSALAIAVGVCRSLPAVGDGDGGCSAADSAGDFTTVVFDTVTLGGGLTAFYAEGTGVLTICSGAAGTGRMGTSTYNGALITANVLALAAAPCA